MMLQKGPKGTQAPRVERRKVAWAPLKNKLIRIICPLFACAIGLLSAQPARGYKKNTIVLLRLPSRIPVAFKSLENRLIPELAQMNVKVINSKSQAASTVKLRQELTQKLRVHQAALALCVLWNVRGATVLFKSPNSSENDVTVENLSKSDFSDSVHSSAQLALRAAERTYAHLIRLRVPQEKVPPIKQVALEPPVVAKKSAIKKERHALVNVFLGFGGAHLPFDNGSFLGLKLGAGVRPLPWLSFATDGFITLTQGEFENEQGRAKVRFTLIQGRLIAEPWYRSWLSPNFGLGAGAMLAWASGTGNGEHIETQIDSAAAPFISLQLGLALKITKQLRLFTEAALGYATSTIDVQVADTSVGKLGSWIVRWSTSLQWTFGESP